MAGQVHGGVNVGFAQAAVEAHVGVGVNLGLVHTAAGVVVAQVLGATGGTPIP